MDAQTVIDTIAEKTGWNAESKLALCLEYIHNQHANETFKDFLERHAEEEESM